VSHINDSTVTNNYTNKTLYILLLTSYFPQSRQGDFLISNNDQFSVYYICRTTRQFFVNSYTTPWNKSWYFLEFSKLSVNFSWNWAYFQKSAVKSCNFSAN